MKNIKSILKFVCFFSLAAMISPYGFCIDEAPFAPPSQTAGQGVKSGAGAAGRGSGVLPAGGDTHGIWEYIKPHASVETKWDDNIFRSQSAREKDLITTAIAGIDVLFDPQPFRKGRTRLLSDLVLNVQGEAIRYMDHGALSSNNILGNIDINGVALDDLLFYYKIARTQRLSSDLFIDSANPNNVTQVVYWNEYYGVSDKIGSGRYELLLSYDATNTTYVTPEEKANNRKGDDFAVMNSFMFMEDVRLLVGGTFGLVTRPKTADSDAKYASGTIGVDGEFGQKLTCDMSAGYIRWYDEYEKITEGVVVSMNTEYKFNRRLSFIVNAGSTVMDLSQGAGEEEAEIGGSVTGAPGTGVTIPGITDIGGGLARSTRGYLGFRYKPAFDEKLTLLGGALYNRMEYSGSTKIDNIYISSASIEYKIKNWARFSGGYACNEKFSNVDQSSYKENVVTLRLTMDF